MTAIAAFLSTQPLLALFITIALGYGLGAVSIKGFSLGSGAVLFVGLAVGAIAPKSALPNTVGALGLLLFLYGVGIAYGAHFFKGLSSPEGIRANIASVVGVLLALATMLLAVKLIPGVALPEAMGAFAGAGTSTSALQAAMAVTGDSVPATGYSVAYPLGVAVPILILGLYNAWFKPKVAPQERISLQMYAVRVENPYVVNKTLNEIAGWLPQGVDASTVRRNGQTHSAEVHGALAFGDVVLITGVDNHILQEAENMLGVRVGDTFRRSHGELDYLRLFVSNPKIAGKTIREVKQLLKFETSILHLRRNDEDIAADLDLRLEIGDQIGVLAAIEHIRDLRDVFGDSVRAGGELSFASIGIGAALGLAVGAIPFHIPGLGRFTFGFAGLLLVALFLGMRRRTGGFVWAMPIQANLAIRNVGLTLFLAQVGMSSGQTFVNTVTQNGLIYLLLGALIVAVLTIAVLVITVYLFKIPFDLAAGVVSGATGNPAILAFTSRTIGSDKPDIGYAMIFPSMTILKIIVVQIVGAIGLG